MFEPIKPKIMKLKAFLIGLSIVTLTACGGKEESKEEKESGDSQETEETTNPTPQRTNMGDLSIAWVDVDSVSLRYKRILDANLEAEEMLKKAENEVRSLEANFQAYFNKVQNEFPTMLKSQQEAAQKKLQNMELLSWPKD